jgi:type II secretory pathway pseudopilin PulG
MEVGPIAIAVALISGFASFLIGRWLSRNRREKKARQQRAAVEAGQSRQVRRARERKQR